MSTPRTLVAGAGKLANEVRVGLGASAGQWTDRHALPPRAMERVTAIVHAAARHKPHIETHDNSEFVAVNVQGTLNLLEEAVADGSKVDRFVFTSTTSLMISQQIRDGRAGGATEAVWIDETMAPLKPRNIYGVTKFAAEELCRLFNHLHKLPVLVLRTSRFFPEEEREASGVNTFPDQEQYFFSHGLPCLHFQKPASYPWLTRLSTTHGRYTDLLQDEIVE